MYITLRKIYSHIYTFPKTHNYKDFDFNLKFKTNTHITPILQIYFLSFYVDNLTGALNNFWNILMLFLLIPIISCPMFSPT